jgi:hypothetical protein
MRRPGIFVLAVLLAAGVLAAPTAAAGPTGGTAYDIRLAGDGFVWHGRESVRFTNTTGSTVDTVWFRLWGNGVDGCAAPAVRVSKVTGGVAGPLAVDCTALPVRVRLRPGAHTTIGFDLDITVPDRDTRFGRHEGAAYVTFALPVLAVHDRDGWHLEPYTALGESNYALTADWQVRIDHPSTMAVPTSGVATTRPGRHGRAVTSAHAEKVRDFAFVAGPFREHTARTAAGLRVRVWQGRDVTDAEADLALRTAVDSMTAFGEWYGRYPYPEVDVVTGQFTYGSMEYPTLVTAVPAEVAVSHELAHQWWYALVGNNQYADPWLDESFTHYSALRFTGEEGDNCADPSWQSPEDRLTNGHDYWDQLSGGHYFVSVYLIGACMLNDLEATLGSGRMLAMMKSYATAHRYGVSTPTDFRDAAQAASPVDLTPLWDRWRVDF